MYNDHIYPYDIEVFLQKMREQGVAIPSISKLKGMLFQIMAKAEGNLLIPKNPVQFVEKIRQSGPVQKRPVFTAEEVQLLMEELPFDRIGISIRLVSIVSNTYFSLLYSQKKGFLYNLFCPTTRVYISAALSVHYLRISDRSGIFPMKQLRNEWIVHGEIVPVFRHSVNSSHNYTNKKQPEAV